MITTQPQQIIESTAVPSARLVAVKPLVSIAAVPDEPVIAVPPAPRPIKRQKVTRACDSCKSRKRRCTGELPCSACWSNDAQCTYTAAYTRGRIVEPAPSEHVQVVRDTTSATKVKTRTPDVEEPTTFAGQYLGPASAFSFLRRAWKRFGDHETARRVEAAHDETSQAVSVFTFGDKQVVGVQIDPFRLPDRATTMRLINRYFDWTMPTFRFLHRQTICDWLETYHQQEVLGSDMITQAPTQQAIVLEILATAYMYDLENSDSTAEDAERITSLSERLHQVAKRKLADETGKVMLHSVQARLLTILYLLQTSRPNQAWFTLGTSVQMLFAMGLHRAGTGPSPQANPIKAECRKRVFWAAFTIDTYLSVILGRPSLIHEDDIDQLYPDFIDDEDLMAEERDKSRSSRDCVMSASIFHAKLSRIVKRAVREQYAVSRKSQQRKVDTATSLNVEIATWRATLPPLLSGAVHGSSLIPVFRRQNTILQLAHSHAVMLVNRPLLLEDTSGPLVQANINACLSAARTTLDHVLTSGANRMFFSLLWISQYVTFTSLSVIYVWLLQRRRGRMADIWSEFNDEQLLDLAERVQTRFSYTAQSGAPSLRYSIVLEELQRETRRLLGHPEEVSTSSRPFLSSFQRIASKDRQLPQQQVPKDFSTPKQDKHLLDWENWSSDFNLDPDLWLHLDSMPFINVEYEG